MPTAVEPIATTNDPHPWLKTVRAAGVWEGHMTTRIETRDFIFHTDEPATVGGRDQHPTPMQYVVGAVNGCVTVVIEAVAAEFGFPIDRIHTSSRARQDVRGFRGTADVSPHFRDFVLTVELDAAVPEGRVDAFTEQVERRCPAINLLRDAGVEFELEWLIAGSQVTG